MNMLFQKLKRNKIRATNRGVRLLTQFGLQITLIFKSYKKANETVISGLILFTYSLAIIILITSLGNEKY